MVKFLSNLLDGTARIVNLGLEVANDNLENFVVGLKDEPARSLGRIDQLIYRLHRAVPKRRDWLLVCEQISMVTTHMSRQLRRRCDTKAKPLSAETIVALDREMEFCWKFLQSAEVHFTKAADAPPPPVLKDLFLDLKKKVDLSYLD